MTTEEQFCEKCGQANPPKARFCQYCAAPLPVTHITGSLPEQTLLGDRYQLLSRIGQGGMGAVYKATDTRLADRVVAIKEMSKAGLPAPLMAEAEASFEREATLLAKLSHPNLPGIYDHFTENERTYLVMQFIEGETLEEFLEHTGGDPLSVEQVFDWAEQLCDVLSYLHSQPPPIVFRDLKPANVMVKKNGQLFLIDFGIARIFKPGQSHDTVALGSPGYAAPEQYGKAQSTPRSVLYSLGALLHSLLTGLDPSERPFFFRPASQINPSVPSRLEALLQQMLEMDAERRPRSAQDILQVLRSIDTKQQPKDARTVGPNTSGSYNISSHADFLLEEAHTLYTQKRLKEAEQVYTQALQINNTNPLGWQGRGLTQGLLARHTEALNSFDRALQLDQSLVISWNGKGTALSTLQRHQDALAAFEQALQLDSNNASSWNGKGSVLYEMGRYKQALQAFQEALRLDKNYAPASYGMGNVYYAQQKLKSSLDMFDRAIRSDRNYAKAWNRRGNVLNELGNRVEALNSYEQAILIDKRYLSAWNGKASVLSQIERYSEALSAYDYVLNLNPNFAQAWNGKGNVYYHLGNYSQALAAYDRASKLNPQMASVWHNTSLVLKQLRRYQEALNSAEQAIRLSPNDPDNWQRKAEALKGLRRRKDQRDAEAQALRLREAR